VGFGATAAPPFRARAEVGWAIPLPMAAPRLRLTTASHIRFTPAARKFAPREIAAGRLVSRHARPITGSFAPFFVTLAATPCLFVAGAFERAAIFVGSRTPSSARAKVPLIGHLQSPVA